MLLAGERIKRRGIVHVRLRATHAGLAALRIARRHHHPLHVGIYIIFTAPGHAKRPERRSLELSFGPCPYDCVGGLDTAARR